MLPVLVFCILAAATMGRKDLVAVGGRRSMAPQAAPLEDVPRETLEREGVLSARAGVDVESHPIRKGVDVESDPVRLLFLCYYLVFVCGLRFLCVSCVSLCVRTWTND